MYNYILRGGRGKPATGKSRARGALIAMLVCMVMVAVGGMAVRQASAASAASEFTCAPGYVYSQQANGSIKGYNGSIANIDAWGSSYSSANGLGIGRDGNVAYAYERAGSSAQNVASILRYTSESATWESVPNSAYTTGLSGSLVTGAVNLANDNYLFGGFQTVNGYIVFQLYEYVTSTGGYLSLGYFNTGATSGNSNGDMAFDSVGNLYVVRSGSTTSIFTVSAAELSAAESAHSSTHQIQAQQSSSGTVSLQNVNGIAFDSDGTIYLGNGTQLVHYNPTTWSQIGGTLTSSLGSSTDLASCNSPSTLTVKKNLPNGRVASSDQFRLSASQSNSEVANVTTSGQTSGIQSAQVGPIVAVAQQSYSFAETMASGSNTTLGGYDSSWECVNTNGTSVIAQGSGSSGSVTIPLATGKGASVTCTITNIPKKDGSISWSKVDKDNQSAALSGSVWELTGPTAGSASTTSVADCVADSAAACADQADKDPAAGKFLVNGLVWGNYTLKEKTAPAGYELSDQIHQVTVNKSTTIDLGPIANTVIPRAVLTIKKIILSATGQQSPGVGWFMDTSLSTRSPDGTAVTGDTTRVTTASGSVATAWPITFNDVSESAIVTVAETQQQGYEFSSGSCVVTTSGGQTSTITLSGTSGDVTGITPGSSTSCEFVNREKSGKATWNKTADDGSTLAGSVWTLEYPDGHTVDVTGDGQGLFSVGNLPWGQYKLSEKESPAGYQRDTTVHDFIIDATHLDVNVVDSGSTSIANNKQNVPELPMTGGASTDAFIIVGVGLLALACALGGGYVVTAHRRGQKIFHSKH